MNFKEKLDSLVRSMVEVSEPSRSDIEWYPSLDYFNRYMWSMVRNYHYKEGERPIIEENVDALMSRVLDLDEVSLERFRSRGSNPSLTNIGLWKLKEFIDSSNYTHVFVGEIGELDETQVLEFKEWLDERVDK